MNETPENHAPGGDLLEALFVARQPIFDLDMKIWGYELLYRNAAGDTQAEFADGDTATSQVIADGVTLGRTGLRQDEKTLVNFPMNLLLQGFGFALSPANCVVEILETVEPTPAVVQALTTLKAAGYLLALDDFVGQPGQEPLLELADIVKVDVLQIPPDRLEPVVKALKNPHRLLLAEKVEDAAMRTTAVGLGFSLFQGYFFRSPELLKGHKLSTSELAKMDLLKALADEDFDPGGVGRIVENDLSLSYRLLRYINSASFGRQEKVASIRQASMILGQQNLRKWLQAVIMSDLNPTPKGRELVFFSVYRARFMEMLARGIKHPPAQPDHFFMLGLFSLLDALLGLPMEKVLKDLPLTTEISRTLLGEPTGIKEFLDLAQDLEGANWGAAQEMAASMNLSQSTLSALHRDSLRYAGELVQDISACPIARPRGH